MIAGPLALKKVFVRHIANQILFKDEGLIPRSIMIRPAKDQLFALEFGESSRSNRVPRQSPGLSVQSG